MKRTVCCLCAGSLARWLILAAAPLSAGTIVPFSTSPSSAQSGPLLYTAKNWAGYVAETNFSSPENGSVTAVSGSWIVPKTTLSANSSVLGSACAVWVGIDGFNNNTVEQVGTEAYVVDGGVYYNAWYEM
ncbi:MAG: G1 family glutamic endopeptidase, partial [Thermoguttaceae bacterium]